MARCHSTSKLGQSLTQVFFTACCVSKRGADEVHHKEESLQSKIMQEVQVLCPLVTLRGCSHEACRSALQSGTQISHTHTFNILWIKEYLSSVCVCHFRFSNQTSGLYSIFGRPDLFWRAARGSADLLCQRLSGVHTERLRECQRASCLCRPCTGAPG